MRPVDAAVIRVMAIAAKGVPPERMAREVEIIASEWRRDADSEPGEVNAWLDALREQLVAAVADAEEWLADADRSEPAAVRQAQATLDALIATRDAAQRALLQFSR
jgi:hypothetical protein